MPHGLYHDGDWVHVSFGDGQSMPVPRAGYEAAGYKPPFGELPAKPQFTAHANSNDNA